MSSAWSVPTRLRRFADRNREHRTHSVTHLVDILRLLLGVRTVVLVMRDVRTRIDGFVRWNGQHLTDVVGTSADPLRQGHFVLAMAGVARFVVSSIDARIDRFLLGDRNKLPGCMCELVQRLGRSVFGCVVLLLIRGIGIEGIVRGDREHLTQMMDAVADFLSESFLVMFSWHVLVASDLCVATETKVFMWSVLGKKIGQPNGL